ncbi:unnamed protein product [Echinostoma caproni]|uniref:Uncharacterized protein n=1 Tax=Echinostoma caproni TaxID=27848 RepID=A0A3P8IA21_9TREM|nr:unnamed protein product [Echinostoma caproni]
MILTIVVQHSSGYFNSSSSVNSSISFYNRRSNTNKVPKLSTTSRRRRGAFGRARHWAKRRNLKKNNVVNDVIDAAAATKQHENLERSPSAEKTPQLKTDHHSPCPMFTNYNYDQGDSGSDRTPPATSPLAALRMHKNDDTNNPVDDESFAPTVEHVHDDVKTEEVLRDQSTGGDDFSLADSPLPVEPESPRIVKNNSPPASVPSPTRPSSPVVAVAEEQVVERMNAAPVSLPSPVRDRLRSQRKGRGRRTLAARTSIISSLFQNPLRKNAVVKVSALRPHHL